MTEQRIPVRVQHKRMTGSEWATSSVILLQGEIGVETDTGMMKVGDGSSPFKDLKYLTGPQGPQGEDGGGFTWNMIRNGHLDFSEITYAVPNHVFLVNRSDAETEKIDNTILKFYPRALSATQRLERRFSPLDIGKYTYSVRLRLLNTSLKSGAWNLGEYVVHERKEEQLKVGEWQTLSIPFEVKIKGTNFHVLRFYLPNLEVGASVEFDWEKLELGTNLNPTWSPHESEIQGADGAPGKDGIGITSTTIEYAVNQSGTTHPTTGWSETVPETNPGDYVWTKTTWNYTDDTSEAGYSVGKIGNTGPQGPQGPQGEIGPQGPAGQDGTVSIADMTPEQKAQIMEGYATLEDLENVTFDTTPIDNHIQDKKNPHSVTKAQVGLSMVENYGVASQTVAESGTNNATYMTPLRVAQAIAKLAPSVDTSGFLSDKDKMRVETGAMHGISSIDTLIDEILYEYPDALDEKGAFIEGRSENAQKHYLNVETVYALFIGLKSALEKSYAQKTYEGKIYDEANSQWLSLRVVNSGQVPSNTTGLIVFEKE